MEGGKVRKKLVNEKTGPMSSRGSKRIFYPPCSIFFCCQHKLTDRHALMRGGKSLNLQSISLLKSMIIWIFFRLENYVSWGIQVCECSTGKLDQVSSWTDLDDAFDPDADDLVSCFSFPTKLVSSWRRRYLRRIEPLFFPH